MKKKISYDLQALQLASQMVHSTGLMKSGKRAFETNYVITIELVTKGSTLRKWDIEFESWDEYKFAFCELYNDFYNNKNYELAYLRAYTVDFIRIQVYDISGRTVKTVYFRYYKVTYLDKLQNLVNYIFEELVKGELTRGGYCG